MRIFAVDYGDSRIGLAVSDPLGIIASPLNTVKSQGMRIDADMLASKAHELNADVILLGLPLNMDGSKGVRAEKTEKLGAVLSKISGIKVEFMDERLTTVSAERVLDEAEMRWDKRKKVVDTISAQIILQTYLDKINLRSKNMENENCEIFDEEEIITLQDENGNPIKFFEVACVEYEEQYYVLLSPAEEVEGIASDEVIICKLEDQDDDTQLIVPLQDEELLQKVFDEYLKTADECGCDDCDCEECDDECEGHDHCHCGCEHENK